MSGQPGGVLYAGTILVDVGKVIDAHPALDHLAMIEQISLSTGGPVPAAGRRLRRGLRAQRSHL